MWEKSSGLDKSKDGLYLVMVWVWYEHWGNSMSGQVVLELIAVRGDKSDIHPAPEPFIDAGHKLFVQEFDPCAGCIYDEDAQAKFVLLAIGGYKFVVHIQLESLGIVWEHMSLVHAKSELRTAGEYKLFIEAEFEPFVPTRLKLAAHSGVWIEFNKSSLSVGFWTTGAYIRTPPLDVLDSEVREVKSGTNSDVALVKSGNKTASVAKSGTGTDVWSIESGVWSPTSAISASFVLSAKCLLNFSRESSTITSLNPKYFRIMPQLNDSFLLLFTLIYLFTHKTQFFFIQAMCTPRTPKEPKKSKTLWTWYLSNTARTRTRNLSCRKRTSIPLGHSDIFNLCPTHAGKLRWL